MELRAGHYRANLDLGTRGLFYEITHFFEVTESGEILEDHFYSYLTHQPTIFDPPRKWDPNLLDSYQLVLICD